MSGASKAEGLPGENSVQANLSRQVSVAALLEVNFNFPVLAPTSQQFDWSWVAIEAVQHRRGSEDVEWGGSNRANIHPCSNRNVSFASMMDPCIGGDNDSAPQEQHIEVVVWHNMR